MAELAVAQVRPWPPALVAGGDKTAGGEVSAADVVPTTGVPLTVLTTACRSSWARRRMLGCCPLRLMHEPSSSSTGVLRCSFSVRTTTPPRARARRPGARCVRAVAPHGAPRGWVFSSCLAPHRACQVLRLRGQARRLSTTLRPQGCSTRARTRGVCDGGVHSEPQVPSCQSRPPPPSRSWRAHLRRLAPPPRPHCPRRPSRPAHRPLRLALQRRAAAQRPAEGHSGPPAPAPSPPLAAALRGRAQPRRRCSGGTDPTPTVAARPVEPPSRRPRPRPRPLPARGARRWGRCGHP